MGLFECREKKGNREVDFRARRLDRAFCYKVLSYTIGFLRFCSKGF